MANPIKINEAIDYTKSVNVDIHLSFLLGLNDLMMYYCTSLNKLNPGQTIAAFQKCEKYVNGELDPKDTFTTEEMHLLTMFILIKTLQSKAIAEKHIQEINSELDTDVFKEYIQAINDGDETKLKSLSEKMVKILP